MDVLIYCPRTLDNTNFPARVRILPPVTPPHSHGCLFTHTVHVNPAEHGPQYLEFARAFPRVTQSTWLGRNDDSPVSTATALTLKDLAEIHSESRGISTHCYVTQSMGYRHGSTNTKCLLELILDTNLCAHFKNYLVKKNTCIIFLTHLQKYLIIIMVTTIINYIIQSLV